MNLVKKDIRVGKKIAAKWNERCPTGDAMYTGKKTLLRVAMAGLLLLRQTVRPIMMTGVAAGYETTPLPLTQWTKRKIMILGRQAPLCI